MVPKKLKSILLGLLVISFLSGCATFVPVTDVSKVPKDQLRQASQIRIFMLENSSAYPEIPESLGDVTAYSCKHLLTDPPASKGDALTQLKLKALEMGANGIIDVTFDRRGTDAWGTNCWESVQASGVAVRFKWGLLSGRLPTGPVMALAFPLFLAILALRQLGGRAWQSYAPGRILPADESDSCKAGHNRQESPAACHVPRLRRLP